jgi:xanthine/uracil permease
MAERPKDLIYALDERPPALQLLALGFQHAAIICPYLVMVALVAGAAKLPQDAARNAMGLAMIAVGFLTILQSLRLGGVGCETETRVNLTPNLPNRLFLVGHLENRALGS